MPLGLVLRYDIDPVAGLGTNFKPIRPLSVVRELFGVAWEVKGDFVRFHISIIAQISPVCQ